MQISKKTYSLKKKNYCEFFQKISGLLENSCENNTL